MSALATVGSVTISRIFVAITSVAAALAVRLTATSLKAANMYWKPPPCSYWCSKVAIRSSAETDSAATSLSLKPNAVTEYKTSCQ